MTDSDDRQVPPVPPVDPSVWGPDAAAPAGAPVAADAPAPALDEDTVRAETPAAESAPVAEPVTAPEPAPDAEPVSVAEPVEAPAPPAYLPPAPTQAAPAQPVYADAAPAAPGYAPPAPPAPGAPTEYAAPQAYAAAPAAQPKTLALISMILGIVSILALGWGLLPAVAAVVLGFMARKRQPHAKLFWTIGIIAGFVGVLISLIAGVIFIIGVILAATNPNYTY